MPDTSQEKNKPYRISIAGLGTVGAGVVKLLQDNAALVESRAGRPIEIVSVTASTKGKDRGVDLSSYDWAETLDAMARDPRVDGVVELIGGSEGQAKELVEQALSQGKDVVTANKALLAHHGFELAQLAETNMATLAYEAAVAGGIPIIKSLREGLSANQIESLYGILNGTCNYILSEMRETGRDFDDVLKEAQEKGYAEADPTFDVEGIDAAHKLVLLGALAFGVKPDFEALDIQGIRHITLKDIQFSDELGYRIKLLGMAKRVGEKVMQSMEPVLVPIKSALGNVEGVFNAVLSEGNFVDKTMIEGRGAGAGPTASSVVADIIDLAKGNGLPMFGIKSADLKEAQWESAENLINQCYIHLKVKDESGVLADITACLKEEDVSIDSFLQKGHEEDGSACVVIMTHKASMGAVKQALEKVRKLSCVLDKPTLLRVEDI